MNQRYDYAAERFLSGQLNWLSHVIRVIFVNTDHYTVQASVHRTLADVPTICRIATSLPLTGKSATGGVARAADLTMNSVSGPVGQALIIYHDTTADSTSELIAYLDTAVGLPWNPQGSNVVIHWDRGPSGIFRL